MFLSQVPRFLDQDILRTVSHNEQFLCFKMILNYTNDFVVRNVFHYLWTYSIFNLIDFCHKAFQFFLVLCYRID